LERESAQRTSGTRDQQRLPRPEGKEIERL
jgi:hypothetical protein